MNASTSTTTTSGIIRLQDFLKEAKDRDWKVHLYQFQPGRPYRETYWKIKNTGEVNIVLDVKTENLNRALKHVS